VAAVASADLHTSLAESLEEPVRQHFKDATFTHPEELDRATVGLQQAQTAGDEAVPEGRPTFWAHGIQMLVAQAASVRAAARARSDLRGEHVLRDGAICAARRDYHQVV
jgi:hypothetical protein